MITVALAVPEIVATGAMIEIDAIDLTAHEISVDELIRSNWQLPDVCVSVGQDFDRIRPGRHNSGHYPGRQRTPPASPRDQSSAALNAVQQATPVKAPEQHARSSVTVQVPRSALTTDTIAKATDSRRTTEGEQSPPASTEGCSNEGCSDASFPRPAGRDIHNVRHVFVQRAFR
jgi:hypothetical protein